MERETIMQNKGKQKKPIEIVHKPIISGSWHGKDANRMAFKRFLSVLATTAIYVFGCSDNVRRDMGTLLRDCARQHGGKGGGRPSFAQGGGSPAILPAAIDAVRAAR